MNFITKMRNRYRSIPIGYSGHEDPADYDPVKVAVSKGAKILERHVGIATAEFGVNAYSSVPEQVDLWVQAALKAQSIGGETDEKQVLPAETESLQTLMRGVYAAKPIPAGKTIAQDDVYFAMPCTKETMTSGEFGQYRTTFTASKDYQKDAPIKEQSPPDHISKVRNIVHDVKGMLYEAHIELGKDIQIELSHHYGIDSFRQYGAVLASIVNRSYCKKVIVVFPGQQHPSHYHRKKEETFQVLWGVLEVDLEGVINVLRAGEKMLVKPGQAHAFRSDAGAIFEEVSSTHERDDSVYLNEAIAAMDPMERKTIIENW
jgi:N-acetylneuraminate synthase